MAAAVTGDEFEEESISKWESLRLKTLAEQSYTSGDLKSALKYTKRAHRLCPTLDGVSDMLTVIKILNSAAITAANPHWYKILEVEPFSHIDLIKKQYKKLALILHPDKNTFFASEEAFKLVNEAFRFLSDKIRRKEYDMKLRIEMQTAAVMGAAAVALDTFWTSCSTCRLLHQFERKYLGHNLMCPNCKKSFKAVEVDDGKKVDTSVNDDDDDDRVLSRRDSKRKMSSVGDIMKRSEGMKKIDRSEKEDVSKLSKVRNSARLKEKRKIINDVDDDEEMMTLAEMRKLVKTDDDDDDDDVEEMMTLAEMQKLVKTNVNKSDDEEEMMTLAEMQKVVKTNLSDGKLKVKLKVNVKDKLQRKGSTRANSKNKTNGEGKNHDLDVMTVEDSDFYDFDKGRVEKSFKKGQIWALYDDDDDGMQKVVKTNLSDGKLKVNVKDKLQRKGSTRANSKNKTIGEGKNHDLDVMTVEDSDFYDFDKGRVEKSFKKGQIWALYDDDDGMPRHYGLIEEVFSTHPFEVNMAWLDPQSNGDDVLINLERTGFHISCGRFKVSKKTSVTSVNVFSHIVYCERAAREVYRIYPKKGSVWALYRENSVNRENRRFDIVVFLTSYSEVHGLSMGYLEKIDGYKTIFRRREIGCHAIKWLEKHEVQLFSHQIPARKVSEEEVTDVSGDCWELDPAALPTHLLTID